MICSALNWLVFIGSSWWKNPNISNWPVLGSQDTAWLDNAHRQLDVAVLSAYGWPAELSDEQILERLLTLNLERAAGQGAVAAAVVPEQDDTPD
jgi:hypothetical protein